MPVVSQDADPRRDPDAGDHGSQGRRNDEGGHRECGQHSEPGPVRLAPGCLSRPQHRHADEEDGAVFLHACRVDDTDRAHADGARQREPHHAAEAEVPRQEVDRGDGRDPRGQLRELGPPRTLGMQVDERPLEEVEPGCGEPHVPCRADSHPRRQGGPGVIAIEAEGRQPLHSHGGAGPDQDEEDDRRGPAVQPLRRGGGNNGSLGGRRRLRGHTEFGRRPAHGLPRFPRRPFTTVVARPARTPPSSDD